MQKEVIIVNESGERLDKYISVKLNISRENAKRLISDNHVFINEKVIIKQNHKIKYNDKIEITIPKPIPTEIQAENMNLDIIFEDENIIVINKPNNVVVHPAPGHIKGTLLNGLINHCGELSSVGGVERPGVVHRLDKQTTGSIVFAKKDNAHHHISQQFKDKTNTRIYHAIVHGVIENDTGRIVAPIGRNENNRKTFEVKEKNSKNAITHFKVLERFKNHTYIELQLETGRTHQIRVHMKYINHPVLGDEVYGLKKHISDFGQFLHAKTLGIIHPVSEEYVEFTTNLPKEFTEKLKELR